MTARSSIPARHGRPRDTVVKFVNGVLALRGLAVDGAPRSLKKARGRRTNRSTPCGRFRSGLPEGAQILSRYELLSGGLVIAVLRECAENYQHDRPVRDPDGVALCMRLADALETQLTGRACPNSPSNCVNGVPGPSWSLYLATTTGSATCVYPPTRVATC